MTNTDSLQALALSLERDLFDRHGPLISDDDLREALGYKTMDAFRQAITRKRVAVPVFPLEKRRGKYALVKDVALWLAQQRNAVAA
jgi:hypothetical protein